MAGGLSLDLPWVGENFSPPTPIDIATLEAAIVVQLETYLGQALTEQVVEVTHFPDRPERYEMRHRIGVAMVIYMGSTFGPIFDIGHVAQERTLEFAVGLRIRDLGWAFGGPPSGTSPGAYQIVEATRRALLGFQPNTGCTPMKAVRERFIARDKQGGVWVYESTFSTRTVVVEEFQTPRFPLFTKGTALEEAGQTTVQLGIAQFTFSGNTLSLGQPNISAVIVKNLALTVTYVQGVDYSLDGLHSVLTLLPNSAIPVGGTVMVSYGYSDVVTALASGGNIPFAPNN